MNQLSLLSDEELDAAEPFVPPDELEERTAAVRREKRARGERPIGVSPWTVPNCSASCDEPIGD